MGFGYSRSTSSSERFVLFCPQLFVFHCVGHKKKKNVAQTHTHTVESPNSGPVKECARRVSSPCVDLLTCNKSHFSAVALPVLSVWRTYERHACTDTVTMYTNHTKKVGFVCPLDQISTLFFSLGGFCLSFSRILRTKLFNSHVHCKKPVFLCADILPLLLTLKAEYNRVP